MWTTRTWVGYRFASEPTWAVTLDLCETLIAEPPGDSHSANRQIFRADGTLALLPYHGEFFDRTRLIDPFEVISETSNSDHELGLDMYFGDRIVQTLSTTTSTTLVS